MRILSTTLLVTFCLAQNSHAMLKNIWSNPKEETKEFIMSNWVYRSPGLEYEDTQWTHMVPQLDSISAPKQLRPSRLGNIEPEFEAYERIQSAKILFIPWWVKRAYVCIEQGEDKPSISRQYALYTHTKIFLGALVGYGTLQAWRYGWFDTLFTKK